MLGESSAFDAGQAGSIGPYELRGELGRGAMARVWRAWDPVLCREVAIKEPLFDPRLGDAVLEEMGRRFVREAKTAAGLNHPGIVTIYSADVYDGRPAIVMELVQGATLGDILKSGPLDPVDVQDALDQLLDAVGYAHEQGVIHRDIKPDNIFVGADGRVKLADFGIARVDGAAATQATVVGAVLGTPGYMSPEQARGAKVDARSDLFSTGVVAYEMLSGRNPFGADGQTDSTTLIYRIVHEPVPELPAPKIAYDGMDADLRPAIMAALEKDPADRPQTAAAFKAMLHGGRTADAFQQARRRPTESGLATRKDSASAKRPKWLPSALVAGVLAVAVGVLFVSANAGGGPVGGASAGKSAYYLGISNNKVALFNGGSNELVEETDIQADTLGADDAAALGNRIAFESIEKAEQQISEFRGQAAKGAVPPVFTSFTASSVSTADTIDAYGPQMAMDGNAKTAWNTDGESVGDGTGQWMQLAASDPQRVSGISILPGFCKDRDTWAKNRRPHAITVSFSDGSSFSAELADKYNKYQELSLPAPVDTTFVRITVDSTYAPTYSGRCYDDCTISEIRIS